MNGKSDIAAISFKEELELDDILPILETGKMFNLIEVNSGHVSITDKGYLLLAATPTQRSLILKDAVMNLKPFQNFIDFIKQSVDGYVTKRDLVQYYSANYSDDDYYEFINNFDRFIGWGRITLLIHYDSIKETIRLRNEDVT
jgi:hypothetical protein